MRFPPKFATTYGPWAVVTGASSGIGEEFARQLARHGIAVALVARREDRLEAVATEIAAEYSVRTKVIVADLSTDTGWRAVVAAMDGLDVGLLVNNAGASLAGSFFRDPIERHLNLISLNDTAAIALAHAFGRRLADRGSGGIIFVSSVCSRSFPWLASYSASKAFLSCFGKSLRHELRKKGVNVLVLEPAAVKTNMSDRAAQYVDTNKLGGGKFMLRSTCVSEALRSLIAGKARCIPGYKYKLVMFLSGLMPTSVRFWINDIAMRRAFKPELMTYE